MADTWSPATYLKFEDQRTRPARDLLAQVPLADARHIVDMGCGPGNSTELLVERFSDAEVLGLDSSPRMIEEARVRVKAARFEYADAATWVPEVGTDLIFANAIYQWVPNHMEVLPRQLAGLEPGGVLAVQMPDNLGEPTHRLMREVARAGPWNQKLAHVERGALPPLRDYYEALRPHAKSIEMWHTAYNHVLGDASAIVEWVKGTGLRPFLAPLDADERSEFLGRYLEAIDEAYPATCDGKVILRFPRLFIVALRSFDSP